MATSSQQQQHCQTRQQQHMWMQLHHHFSVRLLQTHQVQLLLTLQVLLLLQQQQLLSRLQAADAGGGVSVKLPAQLVLPDAGSPCKMEQQLVRLMRQGLKGRMASEEYYGLMGQLRRTFDAFRQQQVAADQLDQLQCMYVYVLEAVEEGQLVDVVAALRSLFKQHGAVS